MTIILQDYDFPIAFLNVILILQIVALFCSQQLYIFAAGTFPIASTLLQSGIAISCGYSLILCIIADGWWIAKRKKEMKGWL